jgi:hypothetical protein
MDLPVLGFFKALDKKENKVKELEKETLRIYRALAASYKSTIIPMVRWSLVRAGFRLNPDRLSAAVTLHPEICIERISLPEISPQKCMQPETLRLPL